MHERPAPWLDVFVPKTCSLRETVEQANRRAVDIGGVAGLQLWADFCGRGYKTLIGAGARQGFVTVTGLLIEFARGGGRLSWGPGSFGSWQGSVPALVLRVMLKQGVSHSSPKFPTFLSSGSWGVGGDVRKCPEMSKNVRF